MNHPMLTPMFALILWTFVMWIWLYATRIPAMRAAGLDPARIQQKSDLDVLPIEARRVADNYNHLHEQPVIFYALVTYCVLSATADSTGVTLAWGYVGARVLHSLVQCLWNFVPVRFAIFAVSELLLMAIGLRSLTALIGR